MLNSNLLLVKLDEAEKQTEDGIFVQEEWEERKGFGTIIEIADDITFGKVGDYVFLNRFAGVPYKDNIRLFQQDDIKRIENEKES